MVREPAHETGLERIGLRAPAGDEQAREDQEHGPAQKQVRAPLPEELQKSD
jgi:hypothetical protein